MSYVGHEMGKLDIKKAKKYSLAGMLFLLIFLIVFSFAFWQIRFYWASFYSDVVEIQQQMLDTLPYFVFGLIFMDGT